MATVKNSADLTTESNAVIGAQTAPDAITPVTLEGLLEDIIISGWNKLDGLRVGGVAYDTALIIPATFTPSIHNDDRIRDIIQALMDEAHAQHVLVQGGVQGIAGQFLATITADTNQIIERPSGGTVNAKIATIVFPNDKDGGGFDNGNNFMVSKYTVPAAGFDAYYRLSNFALKLLKNNIAGGTSNGITVGIYKNGTLVGSGLSATTITAIPGDTVGTIYSFDDIRVALTPTPTDTITIELWMSSTNVASTCQVQVINGFFYNEK